MLKQDVQRGGHAWTHACEFVGKLGGPRHRKALEACGDAPGDEQDMHEMSMMSVAELRAKAMAARSD